MARAWSFPMGEDSPWSEQIHGVEAAPTLWLPLPVGRMEAAPEPCFQSGDY
jgi:hypothetical protein